MGKADNEALQRWRRIVEAEAREFGVPYADAYQANIQVELRQNWESASFIGKIWIWLRRDAPENAKW